MQLTNFSYLNAKSDYNASLLQYKPSMEQVSSGKKLVGADKDIGSIGQSTGIRSSRLQMQSKRVSMQNFITFLDSQQKTLQQVRGIYDRMSVLAHRALDPSLSTSAGGVNGDKELLDKEFGGLADELDEMLNRKVNGQLLFGGVSADFTEGVSDDDNATLTPYKTTVDVGTTSGTMTIKFSTGKAPDQIFLFQGELPDSLDSYFDASSYTGTDNNKRDRLIELQNELYDQFEDQGIFTTGPWATPGSAKVIDETKLETDPLGTNPSNIIRNHDTFEIKFNSCEIDVTKKFDVDNNSDRWPANDNDTAETEKYGQEQYDELKSLGLLKERSPDGDSTLLTMVGLNYNKAGENANKAIYEIDAKFTPSLPYNDIAVPSTGSIYPAISFGKIDCAHISSSEKAKKVLANLEAEIENLTKSMGQVAASQRRYENEIQHMEDIEVFNEKAEGRIVDSDYARDATNLATQSLRMGLATQVMSNVSKLKDVLIPLTTEHFRSNVLSSTL